MKKTILISLFCGMLPLSCTFLVGFDENATPEDCQNSIDDDGDGHADCDDQDCWNLPACRGQFEDCLNGIDDDENGLTDCEDPACAGDPSCIIDSQLCNSITGDPSLWMYSEVYPSSPGGICPEMMQCRIDLTFSDGVPRCVLAESYLELGDPCDNDLQCQFGMVCAYSEQMNPELSRSVCMPLCSGLLNIGCPANMECFRRTAEVWDQSQPGGAINVSVFSCDVPVCQVLGLNPTKCLGNLETCYPFEDMLGDGTCARAGTGSNETTCSSNSDCLPRHMCYQDGSGDEPRCMRVCKTLEDCTGTGTSYECVKQPFWATFGVCISFDGVK